MYLLDYALNRGFIGGTRRFFLEKLYGVPRELVDISLPARIRLMFQELGPIYVKVGQLISSQAQALPPEWAEEFDKLQSNVQPFPYEQVRETIIVELGAPPEEIYGSISEKPLAAASLGQVHRAFMPDGQAVVVKVQRPNIQNQVKSDVGIMDWMAGLMEQRQEWARDMDLRGMVNEFGSQVLTELDYTIEAYNAFILNKNLADIPGVRVPHIDDELSADRVLTMEFVDGFKITDLEQIEALGYDRKTLADAALKATIKMILIDGIFHGDLHPGNVLVSRDSGDIVMLDTGMVGELDVRQRVNLISLIYAIYQQDVRGLAQAVRSLSNPFREVDDKAFEKAFERRIGRLMQKPGTPFPVIFNELMDVMRQNGLQFDPSLTLAVKSIMQMQAIGDRLFAGGGIMEDGINIIQELALKELTAENITKTLKQEVTYTLRELSQQMPTLQEATMGWLNQYKKGRFEVYHDTSGLEEPMKQAGSLVRQLIMGILLTGIIVGSAIATGIAAAFDVDGSTIFTTIAFTGYLAATIIAGLAILGILWQLWRQRRERV
jgi:ubiquinone biosynthesis protein